MQCAMAETILWTTSVMNSDTSSTGSRCCSETNAGLLSLAAKTIHLADGEILCRTFSRKSASEIHDCVHRESVIESVNGVECKSPSVQGTPC